MNAFRAHWAALLLLGIATAATAQTTPSPTDSPVLADPPVARAEPQPVDGEGDGGARLKLSDRLNYRVDPDAYSIISTVKGLSTHKPMYLFPFTYSEDYHGDETELIFQISAKQKLFGWNLYFGYTQKSFWQFYNTNESTPFRDTVYNPELFYRWILDPERFNHWGMDIGFDHESNGKRFPESHSWNRVYLAPFQAKGRHLFYLKFWYRIPEGDASTAADPTGDDNPDITDYYGYSEFTISRQLRDKQLLSAMIRGNPNTGRGAASLTWSLPSDEGYVFWGVSLFHGYGESLTDHDREVTRLMVGVLLAR